MMPEKMSKPHPVWCIVFGFTFAGCCVGAVWGAISLVDWAEKAFGMQATLALTMIVVLGAYFALVAWFCPPRGTGLAA
jgi:hypothetical protein